MLSKRKTCQQPRFLFILNEARFFTTHRFSVAIAASEKGCEVHVAAPFEQGPVEEIRKRGFIYHDVPLQRGGTNVYGEIRLLISCFKLLRRVLPDVLHLVAMKPVIYGGLASRILNVPAVVHAVTGLGFLFIRETRATRLIRNLISPLYKFALAHPNCRVIFQNEDDLALFQSLELLSYENAIVIKGCGVNLGEFRPIPNPEGPPIVMFPARLIGDKGIREFVHAAQKLLRDGIKARFVLVGRNDPANPTDIPKSTLRAWESDGIIENWGYQTRMATILSQASIVCMPSYREGMPRVLLEAAACGIPIVTTDTPGCRDSVKDNVTGLLVPLKNGEITAAAIRRLLEDKTLRERFGSAARARALAEFSTEKFVKESLDTYYAVAGKF